MCVCVCLLVCTHCLLTAATKPNSQHCAVCTGAAVCTTPLCPTRGGGSCKKICSAPPTAQMGSVIHMMTKSPCCATHKVPSSPCHLSHHMTVVGRVQADWSWRAPGAHCTILLHMIVKFWGSRVPLSSGVCLCVCVPCRHRHLHACAFAAHSSAVVLLKRALC